MLSSYEASYTYFSAQDRDGFWHTQIADGWVPRPLVFASALCASLSRSVVESPFEYTKVMRQTDKPWRVNELYRGFGMQVSHTSRVNERTHPLHAHARRRSKRYRSPGLIFSLSIALASRAFSCVTQVCVCSVAVAWGAPVQTMRTTAMLLNIFGPYDVIRTKTTWMSNNIYGQFAVSFSVCASSYLVIWPLETLKNMGQVMPTKAAKRAAARGQADPLPSRAC